MRVDGGDRGHVPLKMIITLNKHLPCLAIHKTEYLNGSGEVLYSFPASESKEIAFKDDTAVVKPTLDEVRHILQLVGASVEPLHCRARIILVVVVEATADQ